MIQLTSKYRFLLLLALLSLGSKPLATPIADAASGLLTSSHDQQQEHDQASTSTRRTTIT